MYDWDKKKETKNRKIEEKGGWVVADEKDCI